MSDRLGLGGTTNRPGDRFPVISDRPVSVPAWAMADRPPLPCF
ncbi:MULTISPECIES: hypothetical protein [unclassified Limnothrix]|nr:MULTISPECIES: hypothetical protein [unclassified Limnothrix]